jgi:hypothetical protein
MPNKETDPPIISDLERRLTDRLRRSFYEEYGLDRLTGKWPGQVRASYVLNEFFSLLHREGDHGYVVGAKTFAQEVGMRNPCRQIVSDILTRVALMVYTESGHEVREPRESEVAHMGRFVNELISDLPEMHLAWVEDMNGPSEGIPSRQPTAVIRGVLLSPRLDQRRCVRFWELTVSSDLFPRRIFSDPCDPREGSLFTSYHRRAFGLVFSVAPIEAVKQYATHMRDNADSVQVREWDEDSRRFSTGLRPASEQERGLNFTSIVGYIKDTFRRDLVADLLQVNPAC